MSKYILTFAVSRGTIVEIQEVPFFLLKSPIFNNTQGTSDSLYQVGCLSARVQGFGDT